MLRTGLLLPRSTLFPSLGHDFFNGIKTLLRSERISEDIHFIIDNIGFGINEQEIYSKAEKMILQDDADVVLLFADTRIAEMLQPLFTACNKLLLVVNFGANFPDNWTPSATTITHSLNFCWHAALTGTLAAKETNKQAINTVSYYDGGYRQCFCMLHAHQVNGGTPRFNHVTNIKLEDFTLEPVSGFLKENHDINTLLCLFSGEQAERFYKEIDALQLQQMLNLYVSPMMLDETLQPPLYNNVKAVNVKGYVPWHSSLDNEANTVFKRQYAGVTGNPVNYFSLLGWETGLILQAILQQYAAGNKHAASVVTALTTITISGPRGWLKTDASTHHTYGPSYLASCSGAFDIKIEVVLNNTEEAWSAFTKTKLYSGESSSWRNTYLCI
ncbi:MAG: ABC transporter substrate-binding protein [Chitinophagaceae bacterium]|nr:ABC transporter substrate-binding protein [Chitinophagaceae bacterium]MBK8952692.1 ABC transporter substrate-binding protein [Chitinophagaceae bacterium]